MDELISESVRLVECGRLGEFAPGEMTFDPADGGREALTRERADFVIAHLFGRSPSREELRLGLAFLQGGQADAWPHYAQALLNSNEFLFVN